MSGVHTCQRCKKESMTVLARGSFKDFGKATRIKLCQRCFNDLKKWFEALPDWAHPGALF